MYLQGALVWFGAFGFGSALARLWQRYVGRRWIGDTTPVVGAACGAVASLYVLTIAFLIVSTSNSLGTARSGAGAEAGAVRDAYLAARQFPAADAAALQRGLREYARTVAETEWPLMERGRAAPAAWEQLDGLSGRAASCEGVTAAARSDLHGALQELYVQRRARLAAAGDGMSPVLLGFLVTSACVAPFFFLLMGWPTGARAVAGLGVVTAMFVIGVWLVLQLNHPYASGIRVPPTAFREALVRMDQLDAHPVGASPAAPAGAG
ncbi:hypothetical protein ACFV6F_11415 [Kitasatospora phosalacinea]|uniref:bestrophin-like domain n=1 Tax=Kitasatospora phosalacinea TaxID=2065 RepID=UPI003654BB8F